MSHILALFLFISALAASACGQQNTANSTPVDVEMAVRVEPESPAVGESTLIVTLRDGSGSPVDGASLQVHANMDHAGMMPVDREASQSVNGEYRVPFEWTMGGGWVVTVTAKLPGGGEISDSFDFFVEAVSSESIINHNMNTNPSEQTADPQVAVP